MASTIFLYNNSSFVIQCNPDDKIREIIIRFLSMSGLDSNKVEFVYEGNGPSYEKMTSQTNGG